MSATTQTIELIPTLAGVINSLDSAQLLKMVLLNPSIFQHINNANLTKELVLGAIGGGVDIGELIEKFNNDKDVVRAHIKKCELYNNVQYFGVELLQDRAFIIECIKTRTHLFQRYNSFKDDEEFALIAVADCEDALAWATERVRNTRLVALEACKYSHNAIKYVGKDLLLTKTFVHELICRDEDCIPYFPKSSLELITVKDDLQLILGLGDKALIQYLTNFADCKEVALKYVAKYGTLLKYFGATIKDDQEVALLSTKNNGLVFRYVSRRLKSNKDVVLSALGEDAREDARTYVLDSMGDDLKKDSGFIMELYRCGLVPVRYDKLKMVVA